ncbi:hypothetical protein MNBD_ALPHA06-1482, partial [hydrothermal vent metagenome]
MAKPTVIRHFDQLDSTNTKCVCIAKSGEQPALWVLADRQSAGRGRRNRKWQGGAGNLYASGLYWFDQSPARLAELGFAAALAVSDVLSCFVDADQLRLKWPNDVLACGVKLAGILPESGVQNNKCWLVMGVGINLSHAPEIAGRKTTCLADILQAGKTLPDNTALLPELVKCFEHWVAIWQEQ